MKVLSGGPIGSVKTVFRTFLVCDLTEASCTAVMVFEVCQE